MRCALILRMPQPTEGSECCCMPTSSTSRLAFSSNVLVRLIPKSSAGPTIWRAFRRRLEIRFSPCQTSEKRSG